MSLITVGLTTKFNPAFNNGNYLTGDAAVVEQEGMIMMLLPLTYTQHSHLCLQKRIFFSFFLIKREPMNKKLNKRTSLPARNIILKTEENGKHLIPTAFKLLTGVIIRKNVSYKTYSIYFYITKREKTKPTCFYKPGCSLLSAKK